jgi:signal peptide peptidase SppA
MSSSARYEHLASFALEHPWAVTASMATIVTNILARRLAGQKADADEIAAAVSARSARVSLTSGRPAAHGLAIIPVHGVIAPRMNLFSEASGGTTFETLGAQLTAAMADPSVKTILFDVDSPGGSVAGARELARQVQQARTVKRVIAHVNHLMASAAYWALSGATEIVASPSALVGSIGVLALHDDLSEALAKLGVKRTVISAGPFKSEAVDGSPLSDTARVYMQSLVDTAYGRMVHDIAQGRRVTTATVERSYGQGRLLDAEHALDAALVDRIDPVQTTLERALGGTVDPVARTSAAPLDTHRAALAQATMAAHAARLQAAERGRTH